MILMLMYYNTSCIEKFVYPGMTVEICTLVVKMLPLSSSMSMNCTEVIYI